MRVFILVVSFVVAVVSALQANDDNDNELFFPNPIAEIFDMLSNMDDVIDDFYNKRMGNGEQFYGKRKYKPSGKVETDYSGYGFSDRRKIDAAREFREERARIRAEKEEAKKEYDILRRG